MSSSSAIERELKVSVADVTGIVAAIESCGGVLALSRHWEQNWVLDRSEELWRSGSLLRVRDRWCEAGQPLGAVVTVKRPTQSEATQRGIKEQHEHEVDVADAAAALHLFSQLEYRIARRYEKVRTAWNLEGHEVVLDETPIGPWVEVEGPEPAVVARRLGLPERGDLRNYLSIYAAERAQRPELPEDMVFVDRAMAAASPPGFEAVRPTPAGATPMVDEIGDPAVIGALLGARE